ncbi:MAG: M56 family metallopeptidase [Ruminococcaceae bacterium]|nr:M56 family metallopeptidase [Oscillospiraceae bacterium]
MTEFFVSAVNMSISAGWIVLAVLLLRLLFKKAPKWISVLLWGIVGVRLICPFTFESALSLIPSAKTINPEVALNSPNIDSGVPVIDNIVNPVISTATISFQPEKDLNIFQFIMPCLAVLWLIGIAALLIYTLVSFIRLKKKINTAVLLSDNVFQSENVVSPFVLGLVKPKIYLPFNISSQDMSHVIAHEQAHIRRKDHLCKPLGFLLLAIYWFNPLMWVGYILLCRDIELACDEKVIKELSTEQKADYSQALLNSSINRRTIAACPLAFGEVGVKSRVKSVLSYKKPAFWLIIISIIICAFAAVCFLTNPATSIDADMASFIEEQIMKHHHGGYKSGEFCCTSFKVLGTKKDKENTTVYMWVLYSEYDKVNGKIEDVSGAHIPTVITVKRIDSAQYELTEYWEPRDGAYNAEDIKGKFPWYLHSKALDSQRYIKAQRADCDKKAQEYFSDTYESNSDELYDIKVILPRAFNPIEIVYDDGRYSFVQTVDTAPTYILSENMQLRESREGNVSAPIGIFEEITLDGDNFDSRFSSHPDYSWIAGDTLESLKNNNKRIWQLYSTRKTDPSGLYILLEQKDGGFYIGYGYYNCNSANPINKDDSHIRWLYKLESIDITDVGGADEAINTVTSSDLEELKNKFPAYFDLNTSKGLNVYIWQMAENSYSCGLLPAKDTDYTQEELWDLHKASASLEEMRAIIMSYIPNISQSDIEVLPIQMPHSSYIYNIDDTYKENLVNLFWENFPVIVAASYSYAIDTAVFDIDGDGTDEQCTLGHGPTSGLFTFTFLVTENGEPEYFNIFHTQHLNLRFEKNENNIMMLLGESEGNTRYMSMHIDGENIVITCDEQDLIYWGEQGLHSPFIPK